MATTETHIDVAIIGGGIAGLWVLNLLRDQGYSCTLFEKSNLGQGQSLSSQGMIHGGIKYTLAGATNQSSETIATMPARWLECLNGTGTLDLRDVRILSDSYYLFSDSRLSSKVTAFFGSKAIKGRVTALPENLLPKVFQHENFRGAVYQLQDVVLDTHSLLQELSRNHQSDIHNQQPELVVDSGQLKSLRLNDGSLIRADTYVFAAGQGNEALLEATGLPVKMQTRPLHQVIVEGPNLPEIYAHAVSLRSIDKPRITFTTHKLKSGHRIWYLGGQLAESGVARSEDDQIAFAKAELRSIFSWLDFDQCHFSALRIDRAEAGTVHKLRPDSPFVERHGNVIACWPTKLTLTPMMGDMVLSQLGEPGPGTDRMRSNSITSVAYAPWEPQ